MSARMGGRRRFVWVLGAAAAGLAGLATWRWKARPSSLHDEAASRMASTLSYLDLRHEHLLRFLEDHESALGPALTDPDSLADLCGRFLLSTDFFMNGADESRPIQYLTLYDPYHSPCFNPLTHGLEGSEDSGEG